MMCGSLVTTGVVFATTSLPTLGPSVGHRPDVINLKLVTGNADITSASAMLYPGANINLLDVAGGPNGMDVDGDLDKAGAHCVWYKVDTNGVETVVKDPGPNDRTCFYTMQASDIGFKIKNTITIFSDQDNATAKGYVLNPIASLPINTVSHNEVTPHLPYTDSVILSSSTRDTRLGAVISGTYRFNANGGPTDDETLYLWGEIGTTAARVLAEGKSVNKGGVIPGYTVDRSVTPLGSYVEVSVVAKNSVGTSGVITTQRFNGATQKDTLVRSEFSLAGTLLKPMYKVDELAEMKITAIDSYDGLPVPGVKIELIPQAGAYQKPSGLYNKTQKVEVGGNYVETDINGEATFTVKSPMTVGLSYNVSIKGTQSFPNAAATIINGPNVKVIYSWDGSPNTALSSFYGHGADSITIGGVTFRRPLLSEEAKSLGHIFTSKLQHDKWATYTHANVPNGCQLPTPEQLQALVASSEKLPGRDSNAYYRTSVPYTIVNSVTGATQSHQGYETGSHFLVCAN